MHILSIEKITYKSGNLEILKGISAEVDEGDCISIIGQSGSGKSTLLKICADLLPLSSGRLIFEGKDYKTYNPIMLRRQISYCVQVPQLFGKYVYENVEFPFKIRKEDVDSKRISELLENFKLEEDILAKEIHALSGGEKQRIALIRNLLYTPKILLLDEATASLDADNAEIVEAYVKKLNKEGTTVLWVTHNLEQSTSIFNKRMIISDGKIENMEVIK